jgi:hypothetical protein
MFAAHAFFSTKISKLSLISILILKMPLFKKKKEKKKKKRRRRKTEIQMVVDWPPPLTKWGGRATLKVFGGGFCHPHLAP